MPEWRNNGMVQLAHILEQHACGLGHACDDMREDGWEICHLSELSVCWCDRKVESSMQTEKVELGVGPCGFRVLTIISIIWVGLTTG